VPRSRVGDIRVEFQEVVCLDCLARARKTSLWMWPLNGGQPEWVESWPNVQLRSSYRKDPILFSNLSPGRRVLTGEGQSPDGKSASVSRELLAATRFLNYALDLDRAEVEDSGRWLTRRSVFGPRATEPDSSSVSVGREVGA